MPELSKANLGQIVDELRQRTGLNFVIVWKEEGTSEICIRHSRDLTIEGARQSLKDLLEDISDSKRNDDEC